jgi:hypothetical protein
MPLRDAGQAGARAQAPQVPPAVEARRGLGRELGLRHERQRLQRDLVRGGGGAGRLGPSTAGQPQGTVSAGQSLTLICYDPNGQSISGYATWDQLGSGLWVYDDLMNTPPGGPTGLPQCANYPPNL